jgi:hypothetical protein
MTGPLTRAWLEDVQRESWSLELLRPPPNSLSASTLLSSSILCCPLFEGSDASRHIRYKKERTGPERL